MIAPVKLTRKSEDDPTRQKAIGDLDRAIKTFPRKPNILLVLLSGGDKHVYSGLKYLCDVHLDIPTVCVHSQKIRKEKGQMISAIAECEVRWFFFFQAKHNISRTLP
jgi:hypothetical protein